VSFEVGDPIPSLNVGGVKQIRNTATQKLNYLRSLERYIKVSGTFNHRKKTRGHTVSLNSTKIIQCEAKYTGE